MTVLWILLGAVVLIAALWLFMIFPARADDTARQKFAGRCYAHRGLYDNAAGLPENSLPAFENAMRKGYGCELDVQFTKDKKLIVFHDNDFKRSSGVDTPVWELTYEEILRLPLFGTAEKVPLFSEVLRTVDGRNPLIVEIKAEGLNMAWYAEVCAATMEALRGYKGDYCVESFHPMVVRWLRRNAPSVIRGQLVNGHASSPNLPFSIAFPIEQLWTNFLTRPHFIAYKEQDRNAALRIVQKLGAMSVMWTVRSPERHAELIKQEDAVIFEHYQPEPRYAAGQG